VLDPETLRRVAVEIPAGEAELAAIPGVGPIVAARYSRTIHGALGVAPQPSGPVHSSSANAAPT
jgi:hypothetical protein